MLVIIFSIGLLKDNPELTIKQLIPSGQQISRKIDEKYDILFEMNVRHLIDMANKYGYSVTADFCQKNDYSYLGLTLHAIDDNWLIFNYAYKI